MGTVVHELDPTTDSGPYPYRAVLHASVLRGEASLRRAETLERTSVVASIYASLAVLAAATVVGFTLQFGTGASSWNPIAVLLAASGAVAVFGAVAFALRRSFQDARRAIAYSIRRTLLATLAAGVAQERRQAWRRLRDAEQSLAYDRLLALEQERSIERVQALARALSAHNGLNPEDLGRAISYLEDQGFTVSVERAHQAPHLVVGDAEDEKLLIVDVTGHVRAQTIPLEDEADRLASP